MLCTVPFSGRASPPINLKSDISTAVFAARKKNYFSFQNSQTSYTVFGVEIRSGGKVVKWSAMCSSIA